MDPFPRSHVDRIACVLARLFAFLLAAAVIVFAAEKGEWPTYGHDAGGQRFSPLTAINRSNVKSLKIAWTYRTGDAYAPRDGSKPTQFEATPLYVDGTLYIGTPLGRIIAVDPLTGKERWSYDSHVDKDKGYGDYATRGVSTWKSRSGSGMRACGWPDPQPPRHEAVSRRAPAMAWVVAAAAARGSPGVDSVLADRARVARA